MELIKTKKISRIYPQYTKQSEIKLLLPWVTVYKCQPIYSQTQQLLLLLLLLLLLVVVVVVLLLFFFSRVGIHPAVLDNIL
jgi:Tfp pilus assembly protein PilN